MSEAKIGLVYGTESGNTEDIANKIRAGIEKQGYKIDLYDVKDAEVDEYLKYDLLIMGIPTWEYGGIQEDWEDFENQLLEMDLNGKVVALYGLGDQYGYGDWYLDAMGWLHERLLKCGARMIGYWPTEGYEFEESKACLEGKTKFCGLGLDEDCQRELTDERIEGWLKQIIAEFSQCAGAATPPRQAAQA